MFFSSSRNREGQSSHWAFTTHLHYSATPLFSTRDRNGGHTQSVPRLAFTASSRRTAACWPPPPSAQYTKDRRTRTPSFYVAAVAASLSLPPSHSLRHPPPIRVARRGRRHPLAPRWPRSPLSPPLSPTVLGKTHFGLSPLLRPSVLPSVALARQPRGVARPLESSMSFEWHGH